MEDEEQCYFRNRAGNTLKQRILGSKPPIEAKKCIAANL